ncbi:MAG: flavodoxin family protein [Actinobacteria bacterium]|nr:flavodoxin family protein [Actinomycetota bacterium]
MISDNKINDINANNKINNKIYVLMIYGSPRREGNTDKLMEKFKEGLIKNKNINQSNLEIEEVIIRNLKFSSCIECRHCSIDGECFVNDEMQNIYPKLINCDFMAVSSPVFFTAVSGFLKSFIDRCQRFWALKYELKMNIINKERKGIFISTAGSGIKTVFDCPQKTIRAFFDVLYVKYDKDFLYNNIDFKDDILKNPLALNEISDFAKNLIIK